MEQRNRVPDQGRSLRLSGVYDPDQISDGLTLDTPSGPVDLVAVGRVRRGFPTPLTPADRAYLLRIMGGPDDYQAAAVALRITPGAVSLACRRLRRSLAAAA
jgi:hypothetical protein